MRRITLWLVSTLAAASLLISYQASLQNDPLNSHQEQRQASQDVEPSAGAP